MSEWKTYELGDVLDIVIDNRGRNPSSYKDSGIPVIDNFMIQNQRSVNLSKSKRYIDDETFDNFIRKYIQAKDVLITLVGNGFGNVSQAPKEKSVIIQNTVGLRGNEKVDNDFLFYNLQFNNEEILNFDRGAVQPSIKVGDLKLLNISLPQLKEQKAIAEVLSSLDDKIDLLHRQNKTLEELAQTLFRQWFIEEDFNSTIGDIVNLQSGFAFKSKDFQDFGSNSVIKIKNISNSIVNILESDFIDDEIAEKTDNKFKISGGDILFAMTGAEIGKMGIVPHNDKNLWLNQRVGMLNEKFKGAKYLAYLHLTSEFGYDYIINTASGSAQPNISATDIEKCPFIKLEENDIKKYSQIITPMFEKIIFNLGQIHSLMQTRDTLLPKLMSGEIKVNY